MNKVFDIKSFNFVTWDWEKDINLKDVKAEIDYQIEKCGINAITFSFAAQQEHCFSTDINWKGSFMPKKDELEILINYCKEKGLKIIIKPMINVRDGYWRAFIRFFDEDVPCEPKWSDWFNNYNNYLIYYGELCEKNKVDMLIIGCELVGTDHRETEWRLLVDKLRKVYNGKLTYNCDKYQEHNVQWWDALDYISSSGYYPIGDISNQLDRIEKVVNKYNLPFIFTEAGCPSVVGAYNAPNDWTVIEKGNVSEEVQYEFYKELLEECSKREFIKGFCLWDWPMKSPKSFDGKLTGDYSVKYKKSENLIKKYFK